MLDLNELGDSLDDALNKETPESILEFYKERDIIISVDKSKSDDNFGSVISLYNNRTGKYYGTDTKKEEE